MIRALVVAVYPSVRAGLAAMLRATSSIEVAGEASGSEGLLTQTLALQPDVVLLELDAGDEELTSTVWHLLETVPGIGVVVLGGPRGGHWAGEALRAGVRGVLPREATGEEIISAVTAANQGLVVLDSAIARSLVPTGATPIAAPPLEMLAEALTPREIEVLQLVGQGLGNKMIAARLGISEHTVKFHVGAIMAKLGAGSRTEAVTLAARRGLLML